LGHLHRYYKLSQNLHPKTLQLQIRCCCFFHCVLECKQSPEWMKTCYFGTDLCWSSVTSLWATFCLQLWHWLHKSSFPGELWFQLVKYETRTRSDFWNWFWIQNLLGDDAYILQRCHAICKLFVGTNPDCLPLGIICRMTHVSVTTMYPSWLISLLSMFKTRYIMLHLHKHQIQVCVNATLHLACPSGFRV
jgi:hypothetical protein